MTALQKLQLGYACGSAIGHTPVTSVREVAARLRRLVCFPVSVVRQFSYIWTLLSGLCKSPRYCMSGIIVTENINP